MKCYNKQCGSYNEGEAWNCLNKKGSYFTECADRIDGVDPGDVAEYRKKLKEQVVDVETSKLLLIKLKSVGIEMDCLHVHSFIPAPTLEEILVILPDGFVLHDDGIDYWDEGDEAPFKRIFKDKDNYATAAAKLAIALIDEGHMGDRV